MMRVNFLIFLAFFQLALWSGPGCKGGSTPALKNDSIPTMDSLRTDLSIPGNFSNQTSLAFDSSIVDSFLAHYPDFKEFRKDLADFYGKRNYTYAWFDQKGLIEQSGDLFNRIIRISDEGLPDKIPYREGYTDMMAGTDSTFSTAIANPFTELMITSQYFNYARHVWSGIPESQVRASEWYVPKKKLKYNELLDTMLSASLSGGKIQEPVFIQYTRLREYLGKYRKLEGSGEWETIKPAKGKVEPGDSSPAVAQLRKRLFLTGDIGDDNHSQVYDSVLASGIKRFQNRFGLKPDGIAGKNLLNAINEKPGQLIRKIVVNMERCRWLPSEPTGNYLVVNIPQFKLHAFEHDSLIWNMNVVVGQSIHQTVIFRGDLKYVVFSPYWNVPTSILKNEILPGIKRDPNYLRKHNMEWNGGQVRQKPGPNNSLGLVKFLFPNSHNIYLHDSPAKSLFKENTRAFSHGCVRVAEPQKLAAYLLRNYPEWTAEKISEAMNAGREKYVTLNKTVPVFIVYLTSWVDNHGDLNFRNDIYDRDTRLMDMIFEKSDLVKQ